MRIVIFPDRLVSKIYDVGFFLEEDISIYAKQEMKTAPYFGNISLDNKNENLIVVDFGNIVSIGVFVHHQKDNHIAFKPFLTESFCESFIKYHENKIKNVSISFFDAVYFPDIQENYKKYIQEANIRNIIE